METRYHLRHSSTWVVRLGDGTDESRERMQAGVDHLWQFVDEMFVADAVDEEASRCGWGPDPAALRAGWDQAVSDVLAEATITLPDGGGQRSGGRAGFHTEPLGHLLAEMQWLARAHPGATW
jgi:ring-1,2-phenylacetyl-CoA epoxidase subunit PaaC